MRISWEVLLNITGEYMKESNTLLGIVVNIFHRKKIWQDTKEEFMKESNTLAGNVVNISLRREMWLNTKAERIKEIKVLLYTIGLYIKANKY